LCRTWVVRCLAEGYAGTYCNVSCRGVFWHVLYCVSQRVVPAHDVMCLAEGFAGTSCRVSFRGFSWHILSCVLQRVVLAHVAMCLAEGFAGTSYRVSFRGLCWHVFTALVTEVYGLGNPHNPCTGCFGGRCSVYYLNGVKLSVMTPRVMSLATR
jgi:hypothetical protein